MGRLVLPSYTVIRDTREKDTFGWQFLPEPEEHDPPRCLGTTESKLDIGDYSVAGYEDILCIERKDGISELWNNYQNRRRFEAELERMRAIRHRFVLVETVLHKDLLQLTPSQMNSHVPGRALFDWLCSLMIKYQTPVLFVGDTGQTIVKYLIRHVVRITKERWILRGQPSGDDDGDKKGDLLR